MAKKKKKAKKPPLAETIDRHMLYEASVQEPDFDLDLCERIFKKIRGRKLRKFREDFCGTALLSSAWVERHKENEAWAIDLHRPTLEWGKQHHIAYLNSARERIHLIHGNVLTADTPPVDLVATFNFSCFIFKDRGLLRQYFERVHAALNDEGIFVLDCFGGTGAMDQKRDKRKIDKSVRRDGLKIPKFQYVWDQERFNAINHDIRCHIHFRFDDKSRIQKAFTYNWRLWTLPELQELVRESGFSDVEVHLHGWDDDGESDEIYRKRKFFENTIGWVGYVVAIK